VPRYMVAAFSGLRGGAGLFSMVLLLF
jgi:hypothetical protein